MVTPDKLGKPTATRAFDRKNTMSYLFIALTIILTVTGQLLVKVGMGKVGTIPPTVAEMPPFILRALFNPAVIGGLLCAVLAALTWMAAVSRSDLSFAYPFMSLAIVLVLALSGVLLGETIPLTRWIGVLIVCAGIIVAALR